MGKLLIGLAKLLALTSFLTWPFQQPELESGDSWAKTEVIGKERKTHLEFYIHELALGKNATIIEVVQAPGSTQPFSGFGHINMFDDDMRVGSDPNSTLVGRAQGLAGGASQPDGNNLIMGFTCSFTQGKYNGSSFSILGLNPINNPNRELPVVGGTGFFRRANGYALLRTYTFDLTTGVLIVGYNVTVYH